MGVIDTIIIVFGIAIALTLCNNKLKKNGDAKSMYYVTTCLVVASIIASTISFIAVYMALPNIDKCDSSAENVIIEILAILVTVLMGWNIISVVDFKNKAEELDSVKEDLKLVTSSFMLVNINSVIQQDKLFMLIDTSFDALKQMSQCRLADIRSASVEDILKLINKIFKKMDKPVIMRGKREEYLFILQHFDVFMAEEIAKIVKCAQEEDETLQENISENNLNGEDNIAASKELAATE